MSDLVERLRKGYDTSLYDKAADEIESLRDEIKSLRMQLLRGKRTAKEQT